LYVRQAFIDGATVARDAMAKAAETANQADIASFAKARARLIMFQEVLSGVTAEAGRALAAFRNIEGFKDAAELSTFLKETQGLDLFQLQEMAERGKSLRTTQQISKFTKDSQLPSFKDKMIYYYVNALISGPLTHARYAVGNMINALVTPLVEIPVAAGVATIREAFGVETKDRVYLGEAGAQLHVMLAGSTNGLKAATEAFLTGQSPLLAGERVGAGYGLSHNPIIEGWALDKAAKEGLEGQEAVERARELVAKPDYTSSTVIFGEAVGVPGRSVAAIHSFFKSLRYEQNIAGLAYRTATSEGLKKGADFDRRIAELTQTPTVEQMATASKGESDAGMPANLYENVNAATADTLKELYMRRAEHSSALASLENFTNRNLVAKLVVPFLHIGVEITRNAVVERTPVGFLNKDVRGRLLRSGADADMQVAKVVVGTALMGATAGMVLGGLMTGDGPADPKQRAVWLLSHKPTSVSIGNLTFSYQGGGPYAMLMRFAANVTETSMAWKEDEGKTLAGEYFRDMTKSILDENFMRGVHDLIDAVYDNEGGRKATAYLRSFATNWLPYSVGGGQVARAIDPYQREIQNRGFANGYGILDAVQAKVPWLSERLMPRRDVYGEPISGDISKYVNDPTTQMLNELQSGITRIPRALLGVQLTPEQYDDYSRIAGRYTKELLDDLATNGEVSEMSSANKMEVIDKTIAGARKGAQVALYELHPEILEEATEEAAKDVRRHRRR
jgi:hypothetical protein